MEEKLYSFTELEIEIIKYSLNILLLRYGFDLYGGEAYELMIKLRKITKEDK